jgi:hypothetical protein
VHVDSLAAEHLADERARFGLLERQQPVGTLDHGDPGPEPGEYLGKLGADGAAAQHQK